MIAALLVGYGLGYIWLTLKPAGNIAILKLGICAKLILALIVLTDVLAGSVSWQIMIPLSGDIIYAVLFAWVLINVSETSQG